MATRARTTSYGETGRVTVVDRLGVFLSTRKMLGALGDVADQRFADLGCGYRATAARQVIDRAAHTTLVDLSVADEVRALPKTSVIEGHLPECLADLPSGAFDRIVCSAVLEHLDEPDRMLAEIRRLLAPGGRCFITVPSWLGKIFLELSAFKLGLSPKLEMDDHKMYYDPRDLWPRLVRAGFRPSGIRCRRYKLGLNTYARCEIDSVGD